jgi:hypothetical protein
VQSGCCERLFPDAESVKSKFNGSIIFFDPGGNWSRVECPICEKDAEGWWGEAMQVAGRSDFVELDIVAPCCGAKVSLNDLRYISPAGFGKFVLEATNPNSAELGNDELALLGDCSGTKLKRIWVRI